MNTLNEFEKVGYLSRKLIKNEQGKIVDLEYCIMEHPLEDQDLTDPDSKDSDSREPDSEGPATKNSDPEDPDPSFSDPDKPTQPNTILFNSNGQSTINGAAVR